MDAWEDEGYTSDGESDDDDIDTRSDSGYQEDEADEYEELPPEPGESIPYGHHIENPYE